MRFMCDNTWIVLKKICIVLLNVIIIIIIWNYNLAYKNNILGRMILYQS